MLIMISEARVDFSACKMGLHPHQWAFSVNRAQLEEGLGQQIRKEQVRALELWIRQVKCTQTFVWHQVWRQYKGK
jgi:hypothetical protein